MNAVEYKAQLVQENIARFGRWASKRRWGAAEQSAILFQQPPSNEIEAQQHGNALASTGNYPIGTNACFNVGISGGCGTDCFVFKAGKCSDLDCVGV